MPNRALKGKKNRVSVLTLVTLLGVCLTVLIPNVAFANDTKYVTFKADGISDVTYEVERGDQIDIDVLPDIDTSDKELKGWKVADSDDDADYYDLGSKMTVTEDVTMTPVFKTDTDASTQALPIIASGIAGGILGFFFGLFLGEEI